MFVVVSSGDGGDGKRGRGIIIIWRPEKKEHRKREKSKGQ